MSTPTLLPDAALLHVDYITATDDTITLVAAAAQAQPPCPDCQRPAQRVHSRYRRTLADQPWKGVRVRLQVQSRRWFCEHPECSRVIFTERLPKLAERYARRTDRQASLLRRLAYALGGEEGARLAAELGMEVSPDTLLRQLQHGGTFQGPVPRVLGVDDWAFRRGHTYGTLLVDLERHTPVDLLPDRRAETLAKWLKEHPGVEIISRDRGGAYAEGARLGAPDAQQVADRWHLLKNLAEALETTLVCEQEALREAARPPVTHPPEPEAVPPPPTPGAAPAPSDPQEDSDADPRTVPESEARRRLKQARGEAALALHRQGQSLQQIARATGLDRKTVRRYVEAQRVPARKPRAPRASHLAPFEAYLRQRWSEGCHNATQLWREIQERGFRGGCSVVKALVTSWRRNGAAEGTASGAAVPRGKVPSPRGVVWWLVGRPAKRTEEQVAYTERLLQISPTIQLAQGLVQEFFTMTRQRNADALDDWVRRACESGIPGLRSFCTGLRRDWDAVKAGLTLSWSNGPVEGQVNRLKLVKRQMYGRAGFRLLRARVLPAG